MTYLNHLQVENVGGIVGVYTNVKIPSNALILEITGDIFTSSQIASKSNKDEFLQIGANSYLGPSGGLDSKINHSCDPNCRMYIVGNRAILYSMYVLLPEMQLTFDYSTTSTETPATWQMKCSCKSNKCRKVISGWQNLSETQREEYIEKKMVPMYITSPNLIKPK